MFMALEENDLGVVVDAMDEKRSKLVKQLLQKEKRGMSSTW